MDNTIKVTDKVTEGIFTVHYVPKHYNFEMLASDGYDDIKILYVEYSSEFYRLKDEQKIKNIFKELEPKIIQIMKFYVNENIEFYKHFDIDFRLFSDYANLDYKNNNEFYIKWDWYLVSNLKTDSFEYLKNLTEEQKRFAYGY